MKFNRMGLFGLNIVLFFSLFLWSGQAFAAAMEDVRISTLPDGYEIDMSSVYQYRFKNFSPSEKSRKFYIQLKTFDYSRLTQEDIDIIHSNLIPAWDHSVGSPLGDITFDGNDAENPQLILNFQEDVIIDVHNSADLKVILIKVTTSRAPSAGAPLETLKGTDLVIPSTPVDQAESSVMDEAKDAMTKGDYAKAAEFYLKVLMTAEGSTKQIAQELLGVARERNGQLPHAAAEYQKYLKQYPDGPDADRVRQRLAGVVTASATPQAPLKDTKGTVQKLTPSAAQKAAQAMWTSQYFGSISQYYYRDALKSQGAKAKETLNNLTNDVDFNGRWKNKDLEIKARFTGGTTQNFLVDCRDEDRISAESIDIRSKLHGFYARIGRQTLSSVGVLGRFDGVYLSKQLIPFIKFNTVWGFPVDSVKMPEIMAQRMFEGISFDWGLPKAQWSFNTFAITQQNEGYIDRQAIGGEVRYFDKTKSFFTLVDYDTYFKSLNIFSFNGRWTLPTKTSLSLSGDFRKSPLVTMGTAMQGQGVKELNDLAARFTRAELRQLAIDRSTNSKSLTAGISQDIREDLQWTAEVSASKMEGTLASGGVDGSFASGPDYTYSTELIKSHILKPEDSLITGFSFTDTDTSFDWALNVNARYPISTKLRFNPRFHVDLKTNRATSDHRIAYRPELHFDYNLTKSASLELEGGTEYVSEINGGSRMHSREVFVTSGYRLTF